jgi:hypothetical protein
MYLRFARRWKDGKEHRYWSIVESRRCAGGRVVQRPVVEIFAMRPLILLAFFPELGKLG